MEKAVLGKEKSRYQIQSQDVCCALISMMLGSLATPFAYMLVFVFCALSYIRSTRESTIVVFFTLLTSLARGVLPTYLYALGFTCFFIIVHLVRLLEYNLYEWIALITALLVAPFALQQFGFIKEAVFMPVATYIFMKQACKEFNWIQSRFVLPKSVYAFMVYGFYLLLIEILPQYSDMISWIMLALLGVISDTLTLLLLCILSYLCFSISWIHYVMPIVLCTIRKEKQLGALLILGLGIYVVKDVNSFLYFLFCLLLLFVKEEKLPFLAVKESFPEMSRFQDQGLLKRQMLNYASIFHSLSEYYANMSNEESELLSTMAEALRYNADVISKYDSKEKEERRITDTLEGYQYRVDDLQMEEPKEGYMQLHMDISNIKRGEIRTTLKPLMEALLHRNLEIDEIRNRRFFNGFHICLSDAIPFLIDAGADSVKNAYTSNGDTFSIFRFRQSMVCMISDGMGNGERAQESSRLITSIFQRMMISGITQDAAIKCINKLIQSDTFATLDVLCFNYALGIAYISKSAACPTFLLRNHKIYEISGNALPVGIVSVMQPDCFRIELMDGDEFVMMSDGIEQQEFYEWMRERHCDSLQEDADIFKEILLKRRRKDDSTFIVTSVNANHKTG